MGGYGNRGRASGTDVVRSHGVNFLDLVAEGDGLIDDELEELMWCGLSGKELELFVDGMSPRQDHTGGDLGLHRECVST